ncbi:MAG: ParB/RepB/Spo0J family partition protein [Balneolaceae bacterium]|nr:ParB/RepB/Spo0J family partition protein [Balneolaceae bacterium]
MASKKVLGRGLGAFFPEYDNESKGETGDNSPKKGVEKTIADPVERVNIVLNVPVDHIRANPHQPRTEFDEERLDELADSIKTHGLIQPITVRYIGEKRFELIAGERRLRASKLAGIAEIPAYIREADDEQSMAFALIENIQRQDLNPLEVAMGYKRLIDEFEYTQAEVANRVGKNRTTVTNMLRLLNLPDFIQTALINDQISIGHARALITIEDQALQAKLLKNIINEEWTVRQVEDAVRAVNAPEKKKKASSKKPPSNPFYDEISNRLRNTLSTKVNVKPKAKGGEISIEYYSEEDLERILNIFDSI